MLSILVRYGLPLAAVVAVLFAVSYVMRVNRASEPSTAATQAAQPPSAPFADTLAGAGVVEPQSENISIGAAMPGIVTEVPIEVGRDVAQGDLLFRMDDRQLRGELRIGEAMLAVAEAQLTKLENQPRPEQVTVDTARLEEAMAVETEARQQLDRTLQLIASRAVTQADVDAARRTAAVASAQRARVQAELDLLKSGAWEFDRIVARQKAEQARAEVQRIETELSRLEVRAPRSGEVLQVNVRPGEYAGAQPGQSLLMLGSTDSLHVRIDIDEQDIGRYRAGIKGVAMPRGFPDLKYDLRFKRIEPFVVPKRSLTGDNTERVDTRVLQVIYEIAKNEPPLYVGQQVDVFFKLENSESAGSEQAVAIARDEATSSP
jgi:multidrug resistance efflux pump